MKIAKKIFGIFLIINIIVVSALLIWEILHRNYIGENFFEDILYIYNDDALKEEKGQPVQTIWTGENRWLELVVYDDIVVAYSKTDGFLWAQINDETYTFGGKKLAVGMTREQVEKAMKNSKRPNPIAWQATVCDSEGEIQRKTSENYYDDFYHNGLGFVYDENDCVEYIYIWRDTM